MAFESPALTWWVSALLLIGLPVALTLLISRLLHIKSGCLPIVLLFAVAALAVFGMSAAVDSAGKLALAEVLDRRELLVYHPDGSWNRKMVADVKYTTSDSTPPITETLTLLPARFDELHQGDFVQLRCANISGLFRLTRLADQKTLPQAWASVWEQPFFFLFAVGLMLVVAARLIRHTRAPMIFFLGGLATIGSWWVSGVLIPLWQQSDVLAGSLNTVIGTVREVHPAYFGNGLQSWISNTLFTPTELVLLDILPLGRTQPVLSVDTVDRGSTAVRPGQSVNNVQYSASNPRVALVPDASRSYLWKNSLLGSFIALIALLAVGRVAFLIREQREKPGGRKGPTGRRVVAV